MTDYTEIEIFVHVDENGAAEASTDEGSADEQANDNLSGRRASYVLRLRVPLPVAVVITGALPAVEQGDSSLCIDKAEQG